MLKKIFEEWNEDKGYKLEDFEGRVYDTFIELLFGTIQDVKGVYKKKLNEEKSDDEIFGDAIAIIKKDKDVYKNVAISVFEEIVKKHNPEKSSDTLESSGSPPVEGEFDYYIDGDGLYNFPGRFNRNNIDLALAANRKIESGNNYNIWNEINAAGAYQIMWDNVINWFKKEIGVDLMSEMTEEEKKRMKGYMKKRKSVGYYKMKKSELSDIKEIILNTGKFTSSNQDRVAKKKHLKYFDNKKDWALVVGSWYCGPGRMNKPSDIRKCKAVGGNYPDGDGHVNKFLKTFVNKNGGKKIERGGFSDGEVRAVAMNSVKQKLILKLANNLMIKKARLSSPYEKDMLGRIILSILKEAI